ncbi:MULTISPECIES: hypothetical protein [unclassified Rhizobium]|uniref:hypothetical protein n=1 Tax=unclassified Rhizobium TaxID=2613769 RepID=UPI0037F263B5
MTGFCYPGGAARTVRSTWDGKGIARTGRGISYDDRAPIILDFCQHSTAWPHLKPTGSKQLIFAMDGRPGSVDLPRSQFRKAKMQYMPPCQENSQFEKLQHKKRARFYNGPKEEGVLSGSLSHALNGCAIERFQIERKNMITAKRLPLLLHPSKFEQKNCTGDDDWNWQRHHADDQANEVTRISQTYHPCSLRTLEDHPAGRTQGRFVAPLAAGTQKPSAGSYSSGGK